MASSSSSAAALLITSVFSALHHIQLLLNVYENDDDPLGKLRNLQHRAYLFGMRFCFNVVKVLVLSARWLGNDATLESDSLVSIENRVRKIEEEIRSHYLHLNDLDYSSDLTHDHDSNTSDFYSSIFNEVEAGILYSEEMAEWCVPLMDESLWESRRVIKADELSEIICSFVEFLEYFLHLDETDIGTSREEVEAMGEQMMFLKNLIFFDAAAQRRSTTCVGGPSQNLLAHVGAVTMNATSLVFTLITSQVDGQGMQLKISTMAQKIKLIDSQGYETYTQALSSSKLSSRSLLAPGKDHDMDDDQAFIIAMKNFLDSLISYLWAVLHLNTCPVVSMKDQLREFYEGLRSLRTILKHQPDNFDLKIKEDIGAVICDAGVLILSFYRTPPIEVEFGHLQDLLETIKVILVDVGVEDSDSQVQVFNFPMTNQLGFVDFVLEKLMELTNSCVETTTKSCVQFIQEQLEFLRQFLGDIVEMHQEHKELQVLWDSVLEVAYKVEGLIDSFLVGDLPESFSVTFDSIMKDIRNIRSEITVKRPEIEVIREEINVEKVTRTHSHMLLQRTRSLTDEVVGFAEETISIMDRLMRGSKQLQIVSIVGMPGLGKTTLAEKIFSHPSILNYFYVHACATISQLMDTKQLLLDLLKQIDPIKWSEMVSETEYDVANELRRCLKRKRYLIFLDDIWDIKAWNRLELSFPNDGVGSRILLTSRYHDVAPQGMLDQEPHLLSPLNEDESLELLQRKLFPGSDWPPGLQNLGMQIAKDCKGLPLTIVIIAGFLATSEPEDWKDMLDGLNSGVVSSSDYCRNTLELSYRHLPDYLRPCFLYFVAFREDQEVSVRRVLRLWIAEGLVRKDARKSLEDVAEDHLKDLIARSLIMVSKRRWDGGIKRWRIHDLLREFCLQKAKDEHFFHFLQGYDELSAFNEPHNLRRLCISSRTKHFKESKLFCPRARSLILNCFQRTERYQFEEVLPNVSFLCNMFKLLRVLDMEQIYLHYVPSEISLLVQLAFLAIGGGMSHIPSSIGDLSNLETFILDAGFRTVSLPETLWKLQKLKYFYLPHPCAVFPKRNLDSTSVLYELDRLSGAQIPWSSSCMERLMRKFPNIRKLKCQLIRCEDNTESPEKIADFDVLSRLESLHLSDGIESEKLSFSGVMELIFPANLSKLTLSYFYLSWRNLSTIGKLPSLKFLKFSFVKFEERTWEMKEGEFSKLQTLFLFVSDLFSWKACDDQLDSLQKLVCYGCRHLEEMPCCLENSLGLEMIEVMNCNDTVVKFVRQIEKELVDMGNSDLKVIIRSSHYVATPL